MKQSLQHLSDEKCESLIEMCLREDWGLLDYRKQEKYWILKRYLRETFNRLCYEEETSQQDAQKRIVRDGASGLAVMNTGIADIHYEDIYALLSIQDNGEKSTFSVEGFFVNREYDETQAKKRWLKTKTGKAEQGSLPVRAHYFDAGQTVFNANADLEVGYPHIIFERLFRFPASYLRKKINNDRIREEFLGSLHNARKADEQDEKAERDRIMLKEVRPTLERANNALYNKIFTDLESAIYTAQRRTSYNYRIALAGYYPKEHSMHFYLPICLEYEEHPDFALVVSPQRRSNGKRLYVARTILPLVDAYADARLIMAPMDNWLEEAASEMRRDNDARFLSSRTSVAIEPQDMLSTASLIHDGTLITVRGGYTIGVRRGADDRYHPDITLDAKYKFVSNHHGEFGCRAGRWTFTSFGQNGTRVVRDGIIHDLERGIPFELRSDDQLLFGGHGGFAFVTASE